MSIGNLLSQANFSRQTYGQPGPTSKPFSQPVVERCSYSPCEPTGNQALHRHPFHSPLRRGAVLSTQTYGQPGPASTPFSQSVVGRCSYSPCEPTGNQALHRHPFHSPLWRGAATLQANLRATRPCIDTLFIVRCGEVQYSPRKPTGNQALHRHPFHTPLWGGAATPCETRGHQTDHVTLFTVIALRVSAATRPRTDTPFIASSSGRRH
jgi:hypothetical protein